MCNPSAGDATDGAEEGTSTDQLVGGELQESIDLDIGKKMPSTFGLQKMTLKTLTRNGQKRLCKTDADVADDRGISEIREEAEEGEEEEEEGEAANGRFVSADQRFLSPYGQTFHVLATLSIKIHKIRGHPDSD